MKKYYKDYKPVTKIQPNGRVKQEAEYVGKYYSYETTKAELKKTKIQYVMFTFCIFLIEVGIGLLNNPGNRIFYVTLPYVSLFLPTVFGIIGVGIFVKTGNKMEFAVFDKSRNRIYRSTIAQIILGSIVTVGDICFLLLGKSVDNIREELVFLVGMLVLIVLYLLFLRIQKRNKFMISE